MKEPALLHTRRNFCLDRIEAFKTSLSKNTDLPDTSNLCVYVTGSYGRFEASPYSDLDLFFIHKGSRKNDELSRIDWSLLNAGLINEARILEFPEFSRGGEYLEVHYVEDIIQQLGSNKDDYENYFTARMLLLLESIPIINVEFYNRVIEEVIDTYYRDYHDHETQFQPVFFVNDVQRFWRTLCLNYEHVRNRKPNMTDSEKNKSHLKNLKLKFSRLLICHSMIVSILALGNVQPIDLVRLGREPIKL